MRHLFNRINYKKRWGEGYLKGLSPSFISLINAIADEITERLQILFKTPSSCHCILINAPFIPQSLLSFFNNSLIIHSHISESFLQKSPNPFIVCSDEEAIPFQNDTFDCVISLFEWAWVNDLPNLLKHYRRILKKNGLIIAGFIGENSFCELRQLIRFLEIKYYGGCGLRFLPLIQAHKLAGLLQKEGFPLATTDLQKSHIYYKNFEELLKDLRVLRLSSILSDKTNKPFHKKFLKNVKEAYKNNFSDPEKGFRATLDTLYITAGT